MNINRFLILEIDIERLCLLISFLSSQSDTSNVGGRSRLNWDIWQGRLCRYSLVVSNQIVQVLILLLDSLHLLLMLLDLSLPDYIFVKNR
jgi:hypothetical protein